MHCRAWLSCGGISSMAFTYRSRHCASASNLLIAPFEQAPALLMIVSPAGRWVYSGETRMTSPRIIEAAFARPPFPPVKLWAFCCSFFCGSAVDRLKTVLGPSAFAGTPLLIEAHYWKSSTSTSWRPRVRCSGRTGTTRISSLSQRLNVCPSADRNGGNQ